jgi:hypothetical protein
VAIVTRTTVTKPRHCHVTPSVPVVAGSPETTFGAPGFAGLAVIPDPPTSAQISTARAFLRDRMMEMGPYLAGGVAIGILQLAQRAGPKEVDDLTAWVRATSVKTPNRPGAAGQLDGCEPFEWSEFASFCENWRTGKPFPRGTGSYRVVLRSSIFTYSCLVINLHLINL